MLTSETHPLNQSTWSITSCGKGHHHTHYSSSPTSGLNVSHPLQST